MSIEKCGFFECARFGFDRGARYGSDWVSRHGSAGGEETKRINDLAGIYDVEGAVGLISSGDIVTIRLAGGAMMEPTCSSKFWLEGSGPRHVDEYWDSFVRLYPSQPSEPEAANRRRSRFAK